MEYKLKDLTVKITKGTTPSNIGEEFADSGVMYFRSELLGKSKYIDQTAGLLYISEHVHNRLKRSQIEKNDILFSMAGIYLGKISLVGENDYPANTNQAVAVIRLKPNICNLDYLYYYMIQKGFTAYVNSITAQAAQPNINLEQIGNIKVKLPDINEQNSIANILSAYDDLIENNNKRIRILEQMAENLYKEWFVRFRFPGHENAEFENGLPKGWKVRKIKSCVKRLPFNQLYKANELEKEGQVIVIDQSTDEYLGFHNNEPSHYANFSNPIILFGDHSCKFKLMCKNFSLGENVIPFRSCNTTELNTFFLYYSVHKIIATEEYKRHWNRFVNMKILIPPITLQCDYSENVSLFAEEIEKIWLQNQNLIKQRDMLLPRLMSGKLDV